MAKDVKKVYKTVRMTEQEYSAYMKEKLRKEKETKYSVLLGRMRPQNHTGLGFKALLVDIFPVSVLDEILEVYNPIPPALAVPQPNNVAPRVTELP